MGAKDGTKPLKRGTPEYTAYMRKLASKGGRATRDKHPDHLKKIAAVGGSSPRLNKTVKPEQPPTPDAPLVGKLALASLDSILGELNG